jgi:hypothetical protein
MLADASIGLNDYTGTRNISFTGVRSGPRWRRGSRRWADRRRTRRSSVQ